MTEHTCEGDAGTDCPACAAEVERQRKRWHPNLKPLQPGEHQCGVRVYPEDDR